MLSPLKIPGAYFWSEWQPGHEFLANSYFFTAASGNALIDPLPLDEGALAQIERLGGVARIFITTPDHEREACEFERHFGAQVARKVREGDELFTGAFALRLKDQKSETEFAVSLRAHRAVVVGDSILGTPAGALSLHSDGKYKDVRKAALGLRAILRVNPDILLVGAGQSLFGGAYNAIYTLLYDRVGGEVHRINVDELSLADERSEHDAQPSMYDVVDAEVGFAIGAQRLGYRVSVIPPGSKFCPMHAHAREEELFFVLDGEPSVRTLAGTVKCRKGDFFSLPVGETGTHQLLNQSTKPATVLLLGITQPVEACYYPDSDKLLLDTDRPLVRGAGSIMVQASPVLDYFAGEGGLS